MFRIRNPFKPKNVNVAKISALKQLQVIEALQKQVKDWKFNAEVDRIKNQRLHNQLDNYIKELVYSKSISEKYEDENRLYRLEVIELQDQQLKDAREIEALKAIVSNLRKQKVYAGQKFYDQNDHSAPTVYLCARFNQWYMVRQSNEAVPKIMHAERWQETYGHLVVLPAMNSNLKNLS